MTRTSGVGAQCGGDVVAAAGATPQEGEHQVATGGERLRGGAAADLAAILVERDIADPVRAM